MPRNEQDPAANTQQFRAFAARGGESKERGASRALIVGVAVGVLVVAGVVVLLVG